MEKLGESWLSGIQNVARKKRTQGSYRNRRDSQAFINEPDHSPLSNSRPFPNNLGRATHNDENDESSPRRKEININQIVSRVSSSGGAENQVTGKNEPKHRISSKVAVGPGSCKSKKKSELDSQTPNLHCGRNGENLGVAHPDANSSVLGNLSKVKKVKFKVGGLTHAIHGSSMTNDACHGKGYQSCNSSGSHKEWGIKGNIEEEGCSISDKRPGGWRGVPWKDFSASGFSLGKGACTKQGSSLPSQKSKKDWKKFVSVEMFSEEEEDDDEIRYLEKLKKTSKGQSGQKEESKKQPKFAATENNHSSRTTKDGKKSLANKTSDHAGYGGEQFCNDEVEGNNRKRQKMESVDFLLDSKKEMNLTSRQRALYSSKNGSLEPGSGTRMLEYPNGLPLPPSRKPKEKLTDVEVQLKKAEAAQRRRLQVEKAAKESQAEAIRKILGQDSNRKKREEKIKQRQEELAQEKAANALVIASNTVRWIFGPGGTTVTFSEDMGLPDIFDHKTGSYPPPRERCAGPSCENMYKYRDSKSNLPLCSLQCYKAIREQIPSEPIC